MKKKFLRFQLELVGTKEEDLTEKLQASLKGDYDRRQGIYDLTFGDAVQIGKADATGSLVLCGTITAKNMRMCRGIYSAFKTIAKDTFPACNKTSDILVVTGEKIF